MIAETMRPVAGVTQGEQVGAGHPPPGPENGGATPAPGPGPLQHPASAERGQAPAAVKSKAKLKLALEGWSEHGEEAMTGVQEAEGGETPERMHPRAARAKLAEAQDYLAHLEFARRAKLRLDGTTAALDEEIVRARNAVVRFSDLANARIEQRRRTAARPVSAVSPRPECCLFLDECGNHNLRADDDPFPVFCLCGIIVAAERYDAFDALWKGWKARRLGSPHARVHEPKVRHCSAAFYRKDAEEQRERLDSLGQQLAELEFTCVAAAVDKRRFAELYPTGTVDDFLPRSAYLMCIDFVFERFVHYLCDAAGDARTNASGEPRTPRRRRGARRVSPPTPRRHAMAVGAAVSPWTPSLHRVPAQGRRLERLGGR